MDNNIENQTYEEEIEKNIEPSQDSPESFLKREANISKIIMFITCSLMFIPFTASWVFIIIQLNKKSEWYYFLIPSVIILFTLIVSITYIKNFYRLKKDSDNADFNDQSKGIPYSIARMFKNLHTSLINLNWFSFSVYLYGGLIILFFYLLGGMDDDKEGKFDFLRFKDIAFTYYIVCGTLIFIAINHIFLFLLKTKKISKIITLFGNNVISIGELDIIKKMTRRRNIWITIAIFIVILYGPIWLIKKLLKK